jgi:hypothetical protein
LRDLLEQRWSGLQDGEGLERLRARKRAREAALVAEAWVRSCADETTEENFDLNSAVKRILEEAAQRWTI